MSDHIEIETLAKHDALMCYPEYFSMPKGAPVDQLCNYKRAFDEASKSKFKNEKLFYMDEIKKLKPFGFSFGKYYAWNYIGYSLEEDLMVWKAARDVSSQTMRVLGLDLLPELYRQVNTGKTFYYLKDKRFPETTILRLKGVEIIMEEAYFKQLCDFLRNHNFEIRPVK